MKKKDVVTNIKPFNVHCEEIGFKGFTLVFSSTFNNDYSRRKLYRIRLDWWWSKYLFKVIKDAYLKHKSVFISIGKDSGFED